MSEINKKLLFLGIALLTISIINISVFSRLGYTSRKSKIYVKEKCKDILIKYERAFTKEILNDSLHIGTNFIANNQRSDGYFNYGYHWINKKEYTSDNLTIQADVLWRLILIYKETGDKRLISHIDRSLKVFTKKLDQFNDNKIWITNPKKGIGETEVIALIALSLIDYIEASKDISNHDNSSLQLHLTTCLKSLLSLRKNDGRFYKYYSFKDGNYHGEPGLRLDGKTLLALIKAAKHTGRDDLRTIILDSLLNTYQVNIDNALKQAPDEAKPQKFIHWAGMVYFELATSGWKETDRFHDLSIQLSNWIIDEFGILHQEKNVSDVLQGVILAYGLAKKKGDIHHMAKFSCVIDTLLNKFTYYQITASTQNKYLIKHRTFDEKAIGGVLYDNQFHVLKTGMTSQQMHSVLLVKQYCYN